MCRILHPSSQPHLQLALLFVPDAAACSLPFLSSGRPCHAQSQVLHSKAAAEERGREGAEGVTAAKTKQKQTGERLYQHEEKNTSRVWQKPWAAGAAQQGKQWEQGSPTRGQQVRWAGGRAGKALGSAAASACNLQRGRHAKGGGEAACAAAAGVEVQAAGSPAP